MACRMRPPHWKKGERGLLPAAWTLGVVGGWWVVGSGMEVRTHHLTILTTLEGAGMLRFSDGGLGGCRVICMAPDLCFM